MCLLFYKLPFQNKSISSPVNIYHPTLTFQFQKTTHFYTQNTTLWRPTAELCKTCLYLTWQKLPIVSCFVIMGIIWIFIILIYNLSRYSPSSRFRYQRMQEYLNAQNCINWNNWETIRDKTGPGQCLSSFSRKGSSLAAIRIFFASATCLIRIQAEFVKFPAQNPEIMNKASLEN